MENQISSILANGILNSSDDEEVAKELEEIKVLIAQQEAEAAAATSHVSSALPVMPLAPSTPLLQVAPTHEIKVIAKESTNKKLELAT